MFFSVDMVMRLTSGDSCRANLSVAPGRQVGKTEMSGQRDVMGSFPRARDLRQNRTIQMPNPRHSPYSSGGTKG